MGPGSTAEHATRGAKIASRALIAATTILAGLLALAPQRMSAEPAPEPLDHFPAAELAIDAHGKAHHFQVRLAATEARREQGLMFVREMPRDQGMLFLWDSPRAESFWMKNTYLSLDLLFIAADGTIIHIAPDATPMSEALISSMGPVLGVLELNAGTAKRLGISTGDHVRHPAFSAH
jgi:uncharacterized membrane protein (UPF0127 family)